MASVDKVQGPAVLSEIPRMGKGPFSKRKGSFIINRQTWEKVAGKTMQEVSMLDIIFYK